MIKRDVVRHYSNRLNFECGVLADMLPILPAGEVKDIAEAKLEKYGNKKNFVSETFPLLSHDLFNRFISWSTVDADQFLQGFLASTGFIKDTEVEPTPVDRTLDQNKSACHKAESFFVKSLKQVRGQLYRGQPRLSVYHDEDGRPLLLRKSKDESTALTLVPMLMGKLVVPPGIIVGVDTSSVIETGHRDTGRSSLASYEVIGHPVVTPRRVSPWAHNDPLDRAVFALRRIAPDFDPIRYYQVTHNRIEDFQGAAQKILGECGINPNFS